MRYNENNNSDKRKPEKGECWRCYNDLTKDDYCDDGYYVCPHCGETGSVRRTSYGKSYTNYRRC